MTTPRPPRSGGNRRTPKVAGHTPVRPTRPEQTPVDPPKKSRFARSSKPSKTTKPSSPPESPETPKSPDAPKPQDAPTPKMAAEHATEQAPVLETAAVEPEVAAVTDAPEASQPTASDTAGTEAPDAPETTETSSAATDGPRGKSRPTSKVSTIKPQSNRPSAPLPVAASSASKPARGRLFGWKFVGVVAALAVVFAIVAGIAAIKPGVSLSSNQAFVNTSLTSEVTSQANARICSIFAVNYADIESWQKRASADLTGRAAQEFATSLPSLRKGVVDLGLTSGGVDCKIDTVGVKSIEGDTAALIANVLVSETQNQQASGSGSTRYQVTMQREQDKWLISNFESF